MDAIVKIGFQKHASIGAGGLVQASGVFYLSVEQGCRPSVLSVGKGDGVENLLKA